MKSKCMLLFFLSRKPFETWDRVDIGGTGLSSGGPSALWHERVLDGD
jgi:hypothetical protein